MALSSKRPLSFAIVGCGLIGKKRALGLSRIPAIQLRYACDINASRAEEIAKLAPPCRALSDHLPALADPSLDAVIVSTLNASLCPIALAAVTAGKHVLIEKPGGLGSAELRALERAAAQSGVRVRLGYNHRFHAGIVKARAIFESGALGPLMFLRGRYGHGGRKGYDREWRADPKLSGGGELIDQGVHLIDLASWFMGDFVEVTGHAATYFWDMKVDDNAFVSLRTTAGNTAWLHVSCTEWKNMFSVEIYGRAGKLSIEGLGGSYGIERLTYYKMLPQMGPPETQSWEFPGADDSWTTETAAFVEDIRVERVPSPGLKEGIRTLEIVESIYMKSGYPVS